MTVPRRDPGLIDAMEALPGMAWAGPVWRVVRDGRDPCGCYGSGGRWDNGAFDVLYTSCERNGAIAEMYFHLMRGQPVFPSQVRYRLHELRLDLGSVLDLLDSTRLAALGVDMARYGQLSYERREAEYPRTQDIADVARFLDHSGMIVPSARSPTANVVVFCDRAGPEAIEAVADHGLIDFEAWRRSEGASARF